MAKSGRRYPLVIYTHMINRWWPATLTLALALFFVAWGVTFTNEGKSQPNLVYATAGLGGLALLLTFFFLIIRHAAFVRTYPTYLQVVTPFLRFNISYKRFRGTTTSEMRALFPPDRLSGWRKEIIAPLSSMTAIVINLNGFPLSPTLLRLFLSPFFFKDKTPHIVILVKDWLIFSAELDSKRFASKQAPRKEGPPRDRSILSRLPHK